MCQYIFTYYNKFIALERKIKYERYSIFIETSCTFYLIFSCDLKSAQKRSNANKKKKRSDALKSLYSSYKLALYNLCLSFDLNKHTGIKSNSCVGSFFTNGQRILAQVQRGIP